MEQYIVSWSNPYESESPEDAALQGWAGIEDAVKFGGGGSPSVLVVRNAIGEFITAFDMAYNPPIEMTGYKDTIEVGA